MRTGIYPGTFDPITYGHIDLIKKSLKIVDRVIIATTDNINKDYFFSIDERLEIIKNSLFKDLKMSRKKILAISSGGGHLLELLKAIPNSYDNKVVYVTFKNGHTKETLKTKTHFFILDPHVNKFKYGINFLQSLFLSVQKNQLCEKLNVVVLSFEKR